MGHRTLEEITTNKRLPYPELDTAQTLLVCLTEIFTKAAVLNPDEMLKPVFGKGIRTGKFES